MINGAIDKLGCVSTACNASRTENCPQARNAGSMGLEPNIAGTNTQISSIVQSV